MWYTLRTSQDVDVDFVSSAVELLQSTSRTLVLAIGGLVFLWYLVSTVFWPIEMGNEVLLTTSVALVVCALALWMLPRHYVLAHAMWHIGLAAAITLAIYLFRRPEIGFLYALLPLLATIVVSWPAGLLAEGTVILLAWSLTRGQFLIPVSSV